VSPERKQVLLRIDPAVHDALTRWASDDLRSVNAQVEMLLRSQRRRPDAPAGRADTQARPAPKTVILTGIRWRWRLPHCRAAFSGTFAQ
jgi:hypothetical protein